jgi:hypothetical protein
LRASGSFLHGNREIPGLPLGDQGPRCEPPQGERQR